MYHQWKEADLRLLYPKRRGVVENVFPAQGFERGRLLIVLRVELKGQIGCD